MKTERTSKLFGTLALGIGWIFFQPAILYPGLDGAANLNPAFVDAGEFQLPTPCNSSNSAFLAGEELTYKVYYNWNFIWLSAGEVTFRVIDEDDQYRFQYCIIAGILTIQIYRWERAYLLRSLQTKKPGP